MSAYPSVAVTGGVGCGKSEVGRILAELGVAVLDADVLAHEFLKHDSAVREAVLQLCGREVLDADGELNRRAIGAQVFADTGKRLALEAILHPRIWSRIRSWREELRASQASAALIPLLYEAGLTEGWDAIWCIATSDEVVNGRLRDRGWSIEQIEQRRRAQWPIDEKIKRADVVIRNDGSREALKENVLECWTTLVKRSRGHGG